MAEKVQKVLEQYKENIAEQLQQLLKIKEEVRDKKGRAQQLGIELEDMPILHGLQKFLMDNTSLKGEDTQIIKDQIVPKLKEMKELILEKRSEQDGLYKETNLNGIKTFISDLMDKFYDEKQDYELYSNKVEVFASECIEKYR